MVPVGIMVVCGGRIITLWSIMVSVGIMVVCGGRIITLSSIIMVLGNTIWY